MNLVYWGNKNGKVFTMWMKNKDLVQFKRFSSDRKYLYRDIDQTEYACLKLWHCGVSYSF